MRKNIRKNTQKSPQKNTQQNTGKELYAKYFQYTQAIGKEPVPIDQFISSLLNAVLTYPEFSHVRIGVVGDGDVKDILFDGLGLRKPDTHDHLPRPISGR